LILREFGVFYFPFLDEIAKYKLKFVYFKSLLRFK
jgi:hypothetical protein